MVEKNPNQKVIQEQKTFLSKLKIVKKLFLFQKAKYKMYSNRVFFSQKFLLVGEFVFVISEHDSTDVLSAQEALK